MFKCSLSYPCFSIYLFIFFGWRYLRGNRISTIADGTFTRLKYLSLLWVDFVKRSLLDTCTQFSICTQYELTKTNHVSEWNLIREWTIPNLFFSLILFLIYCEKVIRKYYSEDYFSYTIDSLLLSLAHVKRGSPLSLPVSVQKTKFYIEKTYSFERKQLFYSGLVGKPRWQVFIFHDLSAEYKRLSTSSPTASIKPNLLTKYRLKSFQTFANKPILCISFWLCYITLNLIYYPQNKWCWAFPSWIIVYFNRDLAQNHLISVPDLTGLTDVSTL